MAKFSETARERELFRYYQPSFYPTTTPSPSTSSPNTSTPIPATSAKSSSDTTLTAFAQLGALRLNATRCIIMLVGRSSEYVLAEASKTISLLDDGRFDVVGDGLVHGEGTLKGEGGKSGVGRFIMGALGDGNEDAVVEVEDVVSDERFSAVCREGVGSLIAVPLMSKRGYVIGIYLVLDERPKQEGWSEVEIHFLKDMATTTMNHIESNRVRQRHDRAEKMVKALAIYLEGGESLREWWLNQATEGRSIQQSSINERNRRGHTLVEQADSELGIQDGPDHFSKSNMDDLDADPELDSLYIPSRTATSRSVNSERKSVLSRDPSYISTAEPTTGSSNHATFPKTVSTYSDNSSMTDGPPIAPTLASKLADPDMNLPGKELQEAMLSADVKRSFSRASNLLREAIDLDGVAFYDASIGAFGGRSSNDQKAPGAHTLDKSHETTSSGSDSQNADGSNAGIGEDAVSASLLGYSTRSRSSLRNHADSEKLGSFSEPLLRILAKRYPHGKIFNFEDDGSISSSEIDVHGGLSDGSTVSNPRSTSPGTAPGPKPEVSARKAKKQLSRQAEAAAILAVVPGARSVAWFPLWDSASERWYAGALIWSLSATRVLTGEDELTYMAAWGNSIMAEVARLSALVASRMKVDFVSSISHELRSPLHGILASVEFLQEEVDMPALQVDMVNTINSCGKTLLDTINHVLDFSKVIKKTTKKSTRASARRPRTSRKENMENMEELSDVSILAEEVVDSVYAGRRPSVGTGTQSPFSAPVVVILDISREENWNFKVNVGAFRRVLMNLFSNALKYTETGFVKVALSLQHGSPRDGKSRPCLRISVTDSGKGISREFLKDHLYSAFKQEDALSVGTGLGLSIVRQVLLDVRGTIDIESELKSGTRAEVSIPVKVSTRTSLDNRPDIIGQVRSMLHGCRARIVNEDFNIYPKMSDTPTGILSPEAQAMIYLKSSVEIMLTDWFGLELSSTSESEQGRSDIVVSMASDNIEEKLDSLIGKQQNPDDGTVVVALCDASYRASNFSTKDGTRIFYLRLPATPHKLSTILHSAFCKPQSSENTNTSTSTSTTKTESPERPAIGILPLNHQPNARPALPHRTSSKTTSPITLPPNTYNALLVEDNAINLKLLSHYMTKLSQSYTTATNGLEAVSAYTSGGGEFDIVFMDLQMPTMDGLAAAREIRKWEVAHGCKSAALVALTGAASVKARLEAFGSGMDLFLVKPVRMSVLMEVMLELKEGGREALRGFG